MGSNLFSATTHELRQLIECERVLIYRFNIDWSGEFVSESVGSDWISVPSSVTLREGNLQKPYQSINTSYPIRKTWWLYLLLEKNLAISFAGAIGNRFVDKSSLSSEMANVFGE